MKVRCENIDMSFGMLTKGKIYEAVFDGKYYCLTDDGGAANRWGRDRFVVVDEGIDPTSIDCEFEEMTRNEPATGIAADAVRFDFDRYNSLAALPGIRR